MQLLTTRTDIAHAEVIYYIQLGADIIYVGLCRLSQIGAIPDAMRNSEFMARVKPSDQFTVGVMKIYHDPLEAHGAYLATIEQYKPHCNVHGAAIATHARNSPVKHLATDTIYPNASRAAEAWRVSRQAMSNHLNGHSDYKTIKGQRFIRIDQ